jgi:hypothetical protein
MRRDSEDRDGIVAASRAGTAGAMTVNQTLSDFI